MQIPEYRYEEKFTPQLRHCDPWEQWRMDEVFAALGQTAQFHATSLGVGYEELFEKNLAWVLTGTHLKMHAPVPAGQELTLITWPGPVGKLFFARYYEIKNAQNECVGAGTSSWVLMDFANRTVCRANVLGRQLEGGEPPQGMSQLPKKIRLPSGMQKAMQRSVRYSEIDNNLHMNNAHYVSWVLDMYAFDYHKEHRVEEIEIAFHKEAEAGRCLTIDTMQQDGYDYINGYFEDTQCFSAKVRFGRRL